MQNRMNFKFCGNLSPKFTRTTMEENLTHGPDYSINSLQQHVRLVKTEEELASFPRFFIWESIFSLSKKIY